MLIRLGRQRWRIKGQIQADDKQLWDEEEKVFLPRIHESFEIKVRDAPKNTPVHIGPPLKAVTTDHSFCLFIMAASVT